MRKFILPLALTGGLIGGTAMVASAQGTPTTAPPASTAPDEVDVPLAEVPAWVLHTAGRALPDAEFTSAQLDTAGPEAIFELAGALDGIDVEVDVYPDGTLEEIEVVIDEGDVPDDVLAFFDEAFPDFDLVKVELSERPERNGVTSVWYEFDGTTAEGKAVDVEVNAAATTYLVEPD